MQESPSFSLDTCTSITQKGLSDILFPLITGDRIFFYGDLGSGKTTFIRELLRLHFGNPDMIIRSPTYTYYQKYGENIYHFDLYRIENYEDLFFIGALDLFSQSDTICLIEWPEILGESVIPTKKVSISFDEDSKRNYSFEKNLIN